MDDFKNKADLWHWNINGINAAVEKGELQKFMNEYNPQVLCFNEILIDQEKLERVKTFEKIPEGYLQYYNCCRLKKGYAGTAIFTKVKPVRVDYNHYTHTGEGRSLTMEFNKFILISIYAPHSGMNLERLDYRVNHFEKDFSKYVKELEVTRKKPIVVTGDFNVCHK